MSTFAVGARQGVVIVTALFCALTILTAQARLVRGTAGTSLDNQGEELRYFITSTTEPGVIFSELQSWASSFVVSPVPTFFDEQSCVGPFGEVECGYEVAAGESLRLEVFPQGANGIALGFPSAFQQVPTLQITWRVYSASNALLKTVVFSDQTPLGPLAQELVLNDLPATNPADPSQDHRLEVELVYSLPEGFAFYSGASLLFEADIRDRPDLYANLGATLSGKGSTFLRIHPDAVPADVTPPVSSAVVTPAPNAGGWNNSPVTVTITAADEPDGSGLELIRYEFGTAPTLSMGSSPSSPTSFAIPGPGVIPVSHSAIDKEGNEEAPQNLTVRIDLANPLISASVSPAANAAGWHRGGVSVGFVCTDALSGIASCLPAQQLLSTQGADQSATGVATDNAGNTASTVVSPINIDLTPPVVVVTGVTADAVYLPGEASAAGCETTDGLSGVATHAVLTLSGRADGLGAFTATCDGATDRAGNAAEAVSVSYDVRYPFTGFFRPVDNLPVVNRVRAGQAVPLRFSLGGDVGLGILADASPYTQAVGCTTAAVVTDVEETVTAGGSTLSYDPLTGQYIYVWKTPRAFANSCRRLTIALIDGTTHSAHFEFR
ncbi:MAG: PxKF domain-containing protein [Gammaproteobacteria bacterium]|nr:PxKF domain-containing protein [Gammaproteobacteria bacterium]